MEMEASVIDYVRLKKAACESFLHLAAAPASFAIAQDHARAIPTASRRCELGGPAAWRGLYGFGFFRSIVVG